jgi:hypothetical protein
MSGERIAATATERASLGSFLFTVPVFSSRTLAASLGWTSRTRSPAASSCCASSRPSPVAPSIAQTRLAPGRRPRLQILDLRRRGPDSDLTEPRLVRRESHRGMRCLVRVDADHHHSHVVLLESDGPWRACLISDRPAFSPLSSHATARHDEPAPRSKAKPNRAGRRFASQPVAPLARYDSRRMRTI